MSDIFIETSNSIPHNLNINKPTYLIELNNSAKSKDAKFFLATSKPDLLNGFIEAKGVYIESDSKQEIIENYTKLLTNTSKYLYVEMLFPWHRVLSIRNLFFKAK